MTEEPIIKITDANGNVATIAYWGSEEVARKSLETLENCFDCSDCSDCSGCSRCFDCSRCSDCSGCSRCFDCSRCSDCSYEKNKKEEEIERAPTSEIPVIVDIHQAVYAAASEPGHFDMEDWHTCDTTHCRAGWVTFLAGPEGKKLEDHLGTPLAAWLIYKASDPGIKMYPDFYTNNETALADMRKLALEEASKEKSA